MNLLSASLLLLVHVLSVLRTRLFLAVLNLRKSKFRRVLKFFVSGAFGIADLLSASLLLLVHVLSILGKRPFLAVLNLRRSRFRRVLKFSVSGASEL